MYSFYISTQTNSYIHTKHFSSDHISVTFLQKKEIDIQIRICCNKRKKELPSTNKKNDT